MSSVSVVIPNYNGAHLMKQHLPAVLRSMRTGDELVIIDDCSTDESWTWLHSQFPVSKQQTRIDSPAFDGEISRRNWRLGQKKGDVTLLRNRQNLRFGLSCNAAVVQAKHELIFLINTDVSPHPQTISVCQQNFQDPAVFAVGCLEHELVAGRDMIGGKNVLSFARGMFAHRRASDFTSGETAWASGGSSMFDRQKWLELGGFDPAYYPAYWEDVDLSFRAKKKGWKVLFDANAAVDHNHESTNATAFGVKKMSNMSWQHAQTFVAKNAHWKQKLQYLLWQPYWWARGPIVAPLQLQLIFVGLVLLVAFALRFYQLAGVPHGMTWDEAAIGYNGWSVTTFWRDEWLTKLPVSFKSFGDYKAPLAIYVVGVFTKIFGLNLWAVRLPFAISGVMAVAGVMALIRQLWQKYYPLAQRAVPKKFPSLSSSTAAILAGAMMAVSVWHVHYSRIGFESGIALNLVIWGVTGLLWLLHKPRSFISAAALVVTTAVLLAASLYAYHSSKMVTPLLIVLVGIMCFKQLARQWKLAGLWLLLFCMLLGPLLSDTLYGKGGDRFQQASIFRLGLSPVEMIGTVTHNFISHFTPTYLVHGATDNLRHGSGQYGVLYLTEFFLVIVGILGSLYHWLTKKLANVSVKFTMFGVAWIIIGTLPAAIGVDVPHSNRMLLALPGFIIVALTGWQWIAESFADDLVAPAILGTTLLMYIFLVSSYLNYYYTTFSKTSANDFKDGYIEAMQYADQLEPDVDKILFTSEYQQPYIYALLVSQTSVYDYHNGSLIKYEFSDKITHGDRFRPNTLIIASPSQIPPETGQKLIYGSDGQVKFVIIRTP